MLPSDYTPIFYNPNDYLLYSEGLTLNIADSRYNRKYGVNYTSDIYISGEIYQNGEILNIGDLTLITDITPGIATASKALVVDSSRNIKNLNSICLGDSTDTARYISILNNGLTPGTIMYELTYGVSNTLNNQAEIAFSYANDNSTDNALTFGFYSNTNILRINASQDVDIPKHNGSTKGLKLGGILITASATELNYIDVIAGTGTASKALVLNASRNIDNINALTATTLNATSLSGTLLTPAQTNITSLGTLTSLNTNSLTVGNGTTNEIRFAGVLGDVGTDKAVISQRLYGASDFSEMLLFCGNDVSGGSGPDRIRLRSAEHRFQTYTAAESYTPENDNNTRFMISNNGDVSSYVKFYAYGAGIDTTALTINGVDFSTTDIADLTYLDIDTLGVAEASKALILNSSRNITNINNLSASTLAGTLTTPAQTNITSIGTLSSLDVSGTTNLNLTRIEAVSQLIYDGTMAKSNLLIKNSANSDNENIRLDFAITANPNNEDNTGGASLVFTRTGTASHGHLGIYIKQGLAAIGGLEEEINFAPNAVNIVKHNGSTAGLQLGGTLITASANELNYNDITTLGTFQASKTMTLDSNGVGKFGLGSRTSNCIQFYGGGANKETVSIYRASDDEGLTIATKPITINKSTPLLTLLSGDGNNTGGHAGGIIELLKTKITNTRMSGTDEYYAGIWTGYDLGTPPWKSSGFADYSQIYTSQPAINIACNTSNVSTYASSNNFLITNDGKVCVNTATPEGDYQLTLRNNGGTAEGIYTSGNATILKLENTTGSTSDRISYEMKHNTTWEMSLGGSTHATAPNMLYWYNSGYRMCLTPSGRLGINTASPLAPLTVNGNATLTIFDIGTTSYRYNVSNNTWSNLGGGPVSYSISAYFTSNIYVQNSVYTSSDRRLKRNIKEIDVDEKHYCKLKPSSYNYVNETDTIKMGLIAQDVLKICGEAVIFSENENLKKDEDEDIENVQLNLDYNAIMMMNVAMIKKLIYHMNAMVQLLPTSKVKKYEEIIKQLTEESN